MIIKLSNRNYIVLLISATIIAIIAILFLFRKKDESKELILVVNNEPKNKENFYSGPGKAFSEYIPPQECTPENNCFPGAYLRSQVYTNLCKGNCNAYDRLTREPVNIQDQCFRTLGDFPKQNSPYQCNVNVHGQRNCTWAT